MSLVQAAPENWFVNVVKVVESGVGILIRPLCVNGAVPQKYLAMLMPVSGFLITLSSLAVLIEDFRRLRTPNEAP